MSLRDDLNVLRKINKSRSIHKFGEGTHKFKCKYYNCFLEYESVKDNLIK